MTGGWLDLLACPVCGGQLAPQDDGLRCAHDRAAYPRHVSGLLDLRPPALREPADAFAAAYRRARLAEGWCAWDAETARVLPLGQPPGFTRLYWQVRRESWAALRKIVTGFGPAPLRLADAGAGFPWLSHRLAELGHQVVAFDLSGDADFGLGAARFYPTADHRPLTADGAFSPGRFLPVLGDLAVSPLAAGQFDGVVCNASLHYVDDLADTLNRLARALRAGGALIVVDSPIAGTSRRGDRPGSRVLGYEELANALRAAGLTPHWITVARGWLWQRHRLKNLVLRRPGFEFPVVVGQSTADR